MPSSDPIDEPIESTPSSSDGAIETDAIVDAMEQAESQELQRISNDLARSIAKLIPSLSTLTEADRITSLETMLLPVSRVAMRHAVSFLQRTMAAPEMKRALQRDVQKLNAKDAKKHGIAGASVRHRPATRIKNWADDMRKKSEYASMPPGRLARTLFDMLPGGLREGVADPARIMSDHFRRVNKKSRNGPPSV